MTKPDARIIAIFLLAVAASPASGTIVFDSAYVFAGVEVKPGPSPAGGDIVQQHQNLAEREQYIVNGPWEGSGHATSSVVGAPDLKATSFSTAPPATTFGSPSSSTFARASWRDVLLPGAAGAPDAITFNFSVHAELNVSQTSASGIFNYPNHSVAGVSVTASSDISRFLSTQLGSGGGGLSATLSNRDGGATMTAIDDDSPLDWNSTEFTQTDVDTYDFTGSFAYTAELLTFVPAEPDAPFGAYFISVGLSSITQNLGGTSTADAFSTLVLDSITLPGGAALPGDLDFVFESGTSIAPVPIPTAWLMLAGGISVIGMAARRKAA